MKRPSLPLVLALLALFLAPWIGGQLTLEAQALLPGFKEFLDGVWGGDALPGFAHALVAGLMFAALGISCWREKAIQTPVLRVAIPVLGLVATLGASIMLSQFKFVSLQEWLEWVAYAGAFFGVVVVSGRGVGPKAVMASVAAGSTLAALRGLIEYGSMRSADPSWRIFGGYNNPNALATIMLIGLFCSLALMLESERLGKLLCALGAILMGFALVLTQSKGGYLSAACGAAVLFVLIGLWGGWKRSLLTLIPLAVVGILAFGLKASIASGHPGAAPLGRVAAASSTTEQSAGFRKLLWTSALKQIQQSPQGLGIGTYGFHSSRPGLVQQTHLTHNSYLQVAVEGSPVAALFLLAALLLWLFETMRSARKLPEERNILRAGVIASILAASAHGLIDSGLYYFGIGFAFFALLAVGLQLSADGSGPELVPAGLRRFCAIAFCLLPAVGLVYFGYVEFEKASLRGSALSGNLSGSAAESLTGIAPWDGEAWYLRALLSPDATPDDRANWLKQAAELSPRTRYYRALAQVYVQQGKAASARQALEEVLKEDPNNLRALEMLLELDQKEGNLSGAQQTAERMIAIEKTPYLETTAIPEFIETETLFAREFLASRTQDQSELARLLQEAVDGLIRYAQITVPAIRQNTLGNPEGNFLGESAQDAETKLAHAKELAGRLQQVYRSMGESGKADSLTEADGVFDGALALLAGGNK